MPIFLHTLKPLRRKKPRKRVGRGNAAGGGTYAGRGLKGQRARSGASIRPGFEGGRTTLIMQTPKARGKGFRSGRPEVTTVTIQRLNKFADGEVVTVKSLRGRRLIAKGPAKIVDSGELTRKLTVRVPVSKAARDKIEKAGGRVINNINH